MSLYRIVRTLGTGAFGIVAEAEHAPTRRRVAIKRLKPDARRLSDAATRFRREAEMCAKLNHPSIVTLYDAGDDDEGPFIAFELLWGETLTQRGARQGLLPPEEAVEIGIELLNALSHAHSRGVVHRDVKPSNIILLDGAAGSPRAKLIDFGVSKEPNRESLTALTKPGDTVGSLAFMSPEQRLGQEVDGRTDLYALGVCLYMMMSGRRPFDASTVQDLVDQFQAPPPRLRSINDRVPPTLDEVIHRSLANNRAERFGSAAEMAEALVLAAGMGRGRGKGGGSLEHGSTPRSDPAPRGRTNDADSEDTENESFEGGAVLDDIKTAKLRPTQNSHVVTSTVVMQARPRRAQDGGADSAPNLGSAGASVARAPLAAAGSTPDLTPPPSSYFIRDNKAFRHLLMALVLIGLIVGVACALSR